MGKGMMFNPHLAGKQICHVCGSKEVRYLRRTQTIYCRVCGAEWPAHWVDNPPPKRVKREEKGG